MLRCATHSSYPRIGDGTEGQRLRRAYGRYERGEIDHTTFVSMQDDVARELVREQVAAGMEVVTDGLVRWYDPVSHVAGGLEGIEIGGLVRWFDTNFYVRQPIVRARPARRSSSLASEVSRTVACGHPVKAVVTGPYTLARFSVDTVGLGIEPLTEAYAAALRPDIEAIMAAGAAELQVEEPCLLDPQHPEAMGLVSMGLRTLLPTLALEKSSLATYFGNAEPLYEKLQELPVGGLLLDLAYGSALLDCVASQGSRKGLALGVVDGRNTALENLPSLLPRLQRAVGRLSSPTVLTTSCGLEYLPRDRARRKIEHVRSIARALAECGS